MTPDYVVSNTNITNTPASDWVQTIKDRGDMYKNNLLVGESRDQQVIDAAANTPSWNNKWIPVSWIEDGHDITIYTLPDYFAIGTDGDFVYPSMNPVSAETLGENIKAVLPTRKIVNQIYAAAEHRKAAQPMTPQQGFPYDDSMRYTMRWTLHAQSIWRSASAVGVIPGTFMRGHKKVLVVTHGLSLHNSLNRLGFYGWSKSGAAPTLPLVSGSWAIQGPTVGGNMQAHEWFYDDYAHAAEFIYEECEIDGVVWKVRDVMKDPELFSLFVDPAGWEYAGSPTQPLKYASYHELVA